MRSRQILFALTAILAVFAAITFVTSDSRGDAAPIQGKIGLGALGALPVGLLVLSIGLSLGGTTGYAINPARDLGPRIAHHLLPIPGKRDSDWDYAWIPVVGPLLGAVVAVTLYKLL